PAYPRGQVVHDTSRIDGIVSAPRAPRAVAELTKALFFQSGVRRSLAAPLRASQPSRIRAKNAAVLSRLGALVAHLRERAAEHLHVHWGGTSSTLAMAAAEVVRIPWSLTLHRWDIFENNLLGEKVRSAAFTRVISHGAVEDVRAIVPLADPVVLHMGVDLPER